MLDADFEFVKIKNMLNKSPKLLKEDPLIGIDYMKVIAMIKKKKVLEKTTDLFDPTATNEAYYHDLERMERLAMI
jgi:hypothetical protein